MKYAIITAILLISLSGISQTIWNGPDMTFTKANNADWTLEENQDRITPDVWITRANSKSIFNISAESAYVNGQDLPSNTMWALGETQNGIANLSFDDFVGLSGKDPRSLLNQNMVMKIISSDIYIDIRLTSWTSGNGEGGGGFSYIRSTDDSNSIDENISKEINIYPNPSSSKITIEVNEFSRVDIYGIDGKHFLSTEIKEGKNVIDIESLISGIYIIDILGNTSTQRHKLLVE